MARIMLSVILGTFAPVAPSATAVRQGPTCVAADPAECSPPTTTPWDRVPPGTHCLELLPFAMQAGIAPEDSQWYLNVAYGESRCRPDPEPHPPGMYGAMQINGPTWDRPCGTSNAGLLDPTTTFRCAQVIEGIGGRRQWRPHNEITGLFPGQT